MALNFPLNPADGDTYENYVYDATEGVWNANPQQLASRFITSATQPSTPSNGDGWLDTNTGKTYIYYNDGSSAQWIESGNPVIGFVDPYDQDSTSTGYFSLPKGTLAQRPVAPSNGDMRFNTDSGNPEWYSAANDQWVLFKDGPTFDVQYLIIAGGAGGGSGGGGAGGYRSSVSGESSGRGASAETPLSLSTGTYTVTVGAGGVGGSVDVGGGIVPTNGASSEFFVTSTGGGKGSRAGGDLASVGGSGGGAAASTANESGAAGTSNQGYDGGAANVNVAPYATGGGGGAGAVGETPVTANGGNGGAGVSSSITGSAVGRAGGGGGGSYNSGAAVGTASDGGGAGSTGTGSAGDANTGGGGGGGRSGNVGGAGGSGVVILKYPSLFTATPTVGLLSITNTIGDYKVTQFTAGTGTVTFS